MFYKGTVVQNMALYDKDVQVVLFFFSTRCVHSLRYLQNN